MPTRLSLLPRVETNSPFLSSIATPWCGSGALYVSTSRSALANVDGLRMRTSPVPSVNSTVRPACRTTWPGSAPGNSMSVSLPAAASNTRNPVDVDTTRCLSSPAALSRLKPASLTSALTSSVLPSST